MDFFYFNRVFLLGGDDFLHCCFQGFVPFLLGVINQDYWVPDCPISNCPVILEV